MLEMYVLGMYRCRCMYVVCTYIGKHELISGFPVL
jgi:hypothetical protein